MADDAKLRAVISIVDRMSKPLKSMNKSLRETQKPFRVLKNEIIQFDKLSGFSKMRSGLAGVARQAGRMGAIVAGSAVAGFAAINRMSQAGDLLIKTATNIGFSTDAMQEWIFIGNRQGVATDTMTDAMKEFTKRLAEARNGEGELYSLMQKVNPSFLEQLLAAKSNEEAFNELVLGMSRLTTQQQQILMGDKAMGSSGEQLVKVLAGGADAIAELRDEARKYGAVIDKSALVKSAEFQDQLTNLTSVIKGVGFSVGGALMPEITAMVGQMADWYAANKDVINVKVADFARDMAASVREIIDQVTEFLPKLNQFVDDIGGMKTVMIAAAAVVAGPLLSAIATLSVALLTTPVGWIVTGIGLLVLAAIKLKDSWEPIKAFFSDLWGSVTASFDAGMEKIKPIIETIKNAVKTLGAPVKKLFEYGNKAADAVTGVASDAYNGAKSFFGFGDEPEQRQKGLAAQTVQARSRLDGEIKVTIDSEGRPKVKGMRSNNSGVNLSADVGYSMLGAQ